MDDEQEYHELLEVLNMDGELSPEQQVRYQELKARFGEWGKLPIHPRKDDE